MSQHPLLQSRSERALKTAQAIIDQADNEHRALSADERSYVSGLLEDAKAIQRFDELGRDLGAGMPDVRHGGPVMAVGLGDRFIQSDGWKSVADPSRRGQQWSTGAIDVGPAQIALSMKGTLLEGSGAPGSGSGGGLVPVPQVTPGVVDTLFQSLTLEQLLSSGQATASTVRHVVEGTASSGAAGVAEGGLKPESTLGLSTRDEPVKKIATVLPISEEMLEDAPAIQTFLNARLSLFVRIESERQLLRGTIGGNEVQGILTSRNVPVYAGGTAAGNRAEQLFKAMNGVRGSSFVEPEWIVISPSDYEIIRLLKDTANQYYGGGPFSGSYGVGAPAGASGQVSGAIDTIWGKPVYVTSAIGAGTALVGSSQAARVWNKGGLTVEASNSHSDYWQRNLVALRAERRLALTVFRPQAYVEVRLA